MTEIDAAIAEVTGVRGSVRRLVFGCDIGDTDEDTVNWIFGEGDERRRVSMPRAAFTFERERRKCFWLVSIPEPVAKQYGIERFAIDETEAERHRERIAASWREER